MCEGYSSQMNKINLSPQRSRADKTPRNICNISFRFYKFPVHANSKSGLFGHLVILFLLVLVLIVF